MTIQHDMTEPASLPLRYEDLNAVERRIVDGWIAGGMDKDQAVKYLNETLEDCDGDMDL